MRITKHALLGTAAVAAAIAVAAPSRADSNDFQSPSGNIYCSLAAEGAACDISDYTYQPPPPPECGKHISWGSRFTLAPGKPAAMECHGDTLRVPGEPTLNYGQTASAGTLTCASEESGIKCTDSSSGHYFRVSRDSFNLG
jgi:hypothetical protein